MVLKLKNRFGCLNQRIKRQEIVILKVILFDGDWQWKKIDITLSDGGEQWKIIDITLSRGTYKLYNQHFANINNVYSLFSYRKYSLKKVKKSKSQISLVQQKANLQSSVGKRSQSDKIQQPIILAWSK